MSSTDKILWTDTETTGLSAEKNGIISVACIADICGEVVEKFELEMRPTGRVSDPQALKINGYTHAQIRRLTPWEEVLPEFIYRINMISRKHLPDQPFLLGGQNVVFDNRHIVSWTEYCQAPEYWKFLVKQTGFVDTKTVAKKFPELTSRKLGDMCQHFGVRLENAHNALADIEATRELYYVMMAKLEEAKQGSLNI